MVSTCRATAGTLRVWKEYASTSRSGQPASGSSAHGSEAVFRKPTASQPASSAASIAPARAATLCLL